MRLHSHRLPRKATLPLRGPAVLTHVLRAPSLRSRREDILPLLSSFLAAGRDGPPPRVTVDAAEALRQFRLAGGIDVIITDQNMPEMNGSELARQISKSFASRYPRAA